MLRGKWIRNINSGGESLIVSFNKTSSGRLVIQTYVCSFYAEVLLDEFEFLDGTVCGVKELNI